MDSKLQQEREVNGGTPFAEARGSMMPSSKEMKAFERGMEACRRGAEIGDCPYWDDADLYDFWCFGWEHERQKASSNDQAQRPERLKYGNE